MKDRVIAVDIFRGLTIAMMILVNTPGTWAHVYTPLEHAEWSGYTPTDLVFPFFLFIVGASIAFAYGNKPANAATYKKIAIRSLKIIALGILLGAFILHPPFIKPFANIRFPGVLSRIGVVFFFAAILYLNFSWKWLAGIGALILLGYWIWMGFVPLNGMAPTFERAPNNWANYIDLHVFGSHMWKKDYDPEGLLSTLPAIVTAILGTFTGRILMTQRPKKEVLMVGLGLGYLVLGYLWNLVFPINKALWSSSFVLVTAGWANLVLALIYYFRDVKGITFGRVFQYIGSNAITIYFLSSLFTKIFYSIKVDDENSIHGWLYQNVYVHDFMPPNLSSMLYGLVLVAFYCVVAWWLYKKKIFIKI